MSNAITEAIDTTKAARERVLAANQRERTALARAEEAARELADARIDVVKAGKAYIESANALSKLLHSDVSGLLGAEIKREREQAARAEAKAEAKGAAVVVEPSDEEARAAANAVEGSEAIAAAVAAHEAGGAT